jgi:hypothetical protein
VALTRFRFQVAREIFQKLAKIRAAVTRFSHADAVAMPKFFAPQTGSF